MTLEEIAKMSWEEFHNLLKNQDKETFENPIANMTTLEEIDKYSASIGAVSWEDFDAKIMDKLSDEDKEQLSRYLEFKRRVLQGGRNTQILTEGEKPEEPLSASSAEAIEKYKAIPMEEAIAHIMRFIDEL